ncbi:hypothetical protein N7491_009317 [Penicillium cf. griseofulvum]|uniref:Uncharacterized protein n=1 Tax=Penicillium cf. griseofulvum TaxID=2972120 RepID=A0A9W9ME77_9EURO|nr:hypothetical protein N7472_005090 [Penicillium cf. griseofulvum]KAJ5424101.1 hypothetical protein N7491_009317 [Penicillium cf. griseofulvum]KAJ5442659.1 hypothetical protein N7445_005666 [Penicillium cf. griseofulvum]
MPYNCLRPQPPISADADITGYGVIANYVATAATAVLLIIIYFLVVYEPALDPFRKTDQDHLNQSFRSNPIDKIILQTVRHLPRRLIGPRKLRVNAQVEKCFIECIIAMSDLQIVTGLSILISGYAQLYQGITSFHWMVIVDLAWFSSLTHLACLTLLRNHLYNHSAQRLWRLLCMAALVVLLTVALAFTGGYNWIWPDEWSHLPTEEILDVADPAMCHLSSDSRSTVAYYGMIFSILLTVFGFVARIVKLNKTISVNVWGKARAKLSMQARRLLRIAFTWCCSSSSRKSLKRTILYRPLLTTFLVARLFLDGWSSVSLEVCWLIVGFVWGTIRLFGVLNTVQGGIDSSAELSVFEIYAQDSDERDSDWGFGQVVAVVLLLAPLITIIKYLTHDDKQCPGILTSRSDNTICRSSHFGLTTSPFTHESPRRRDDPNSDWDDYTQTLGAAIIYFMVVSVVMLLLVLLYDGTTPNILIRLKSHYSFGVMALISIWAVIIFSLTIELDLSSIPLWVQKFLHLGNIAFFICGAVIFGGPLLSFTPYMFLTCAAVFYILCAVFYRIMGSTF